MGEIITTIRCEQVGQQASTDSAGNICRGQIVVSVGNGLHTVRCGLVDICDKQLPRPVVVRVDQI